MLRLPKAVLACWAWPLAHQGTQARSESASWEATGCWLPGTQQLLCSVTCQEGLEWPKGLCKPVPENKISEGVLDPPEALLRRSPSQGANRASCRQQRLPKRQVASPQGHPF